MKKHKKIFAGLLAVSMLLCTGCKAEEQEVSSEGIFEAHYNSTFYIKDQELYYTDFSSEPICLTKNLLLEDDITDSQIYSILYRYQPIYPQMDRKGEKVVYPDQCSVTEETMVLYYRDLKGDNEPIKLDSYVYEFFFHESGKWVLYTKEGDLFLHDLEDKEKIDGNISTFVPIADREECIYVDEDGRWFYYAYGEDPVCISTHEQYIGMNKGGNVLYFLTGENASAAGETKRALYSYKPGADEMQCITEEYADYTILEDGLYYTCRRQEITPSDVLVDDCKEQDDRISEPDLPTYPDVPIKPVSSDYDTQEEYAQAWEQYDQAYATYEEEYAQIQGEYNKKLLQYEAKSDRDAVREAIEQKCQSMSISTLYFYDGEKSEMLTENMYNSYAPYDNTIISVFNPENLDVLYMSELSLDADEATGTISSVVDAAIEKKPLIDHKLWEDASIPDNYRYLAISPDKTEILCSDYVALYQLSLNDGAIGEPRCYTKDAYFGFYTTQGQIAYYVSDVLSVADEMVDYDVCKSSFSNVDERLLYLIDYDWERSCGDLRVYENGEKQRVDIDVFDYGYTPQGDLVYLKDYDPDMCRGTLYYFDGKESVEIDRDVTAVLERSMQLLGAYYYNYYF